MREQWELSCWTSGLPKLDTGTFHQQAHYVVGSLKYSLSKNHFIDLTETNTTKYFVILYVKYIILVGSLHIDIILEGRYHLNFFYPSS